MPNKFTTLPHTILSIYNFIFQFFHIKVNSIFNNNPPQPLCVPEVHYFCLKPVTTIDNLLKRNFPIQYHYSGHQALETVDGDFSSLVLFCRLSGCHASRFMWRHFRNWYPQYSTPPTRTGFFDSQTNIQPINWASWVRNKADRINSPSTHADNCCF